MSICPYNKNIKSNPTNTPTNSNNKCVKDERPGSHFPSKVPARRQQPYFESKKGSNGSPRSRNWRHQRLDNSKKDHRFEKYAPGGSYVGVNGKVKEGSKKVSLNHLLNFKFEPRQFEDVNHFQGSISRRTATRRSLSSQVFNKERFLQANSHFIAKAGEDYSIFATDPDAPIPWDYVEKVIFLVDHDISCPICLYPPTVPKITKCGHVYCWPCILHYLALDEKGKSLRDCPICGVDVRKMDLRSVSLFETMPLKNGTEVKMNLMCRDATSLSPHPILDIDSGSSFANNKVVQYSPAQVLDLIVKSELEMLKAKLCVEVDDFEREFLYCAISECTAREADLVTQISSGKNSHIDDQIENSDQVLMDFCMDTSSDVSLQNVVQSESAHDSAVQDPVCYYFYQIDMGGNVFLDGLNVKCLLKEYSHFKNCPPMIQAKVVHVESFIMTEELRKRHKYLSHLPLSCEYKIAELDLQPPLVSQDTLAEFHDMLRRRAKSRQKKEKQENDSRRRAEIAEQRKLDDYLKNNTFIYTESEFVTGPANIEVKSTSAMATPVGSFTSQSSDMSLSPPGMSFAEKLRSHQSSTPRSLTKNPCRTKAIISVAKPENAASDDDDPYYHAPAYQSSFGDALTEALEGLQSTSLQSSSTESGGGPKGKKAKKKKKQTMLFSTSAHMRP